MPYVFGALVALNVALFGYFWFKPSQGGTFEEVKSQVQKPLHYQNNSHTIPPPIGQK